MVRAHLGIVVALFGAMSASPALAQSPPPEDTPAAAPDDGGDGEVRRDPKGQKGISPYMEDVAAGREAFTAGDVTKALASFEAAIAKDAERVLAYLLESQAHLHQGNAEEALSTLEVARSKGGTALEQSKLLLLTAEASERKANVPSGTDNDPSQLEALKTKWMAVKAQWATYVTFFEGKDDDAVPNYAATGTERQTKIDARVERDEKYGAVKKRIADNEAEREKNKK